MPFGEAAPCLPGTLGIHPCRPRVRVLAHDGPERQGAASPNGISLPTKIH
jgi:hypothetical protein